MDLLTLPRNSKRSRWRPDVFRLWFSPSGRRLLVLTGHAGGANRLWNWDVPNARPLGRRTVVNDPEHDNGFPFPRFDPTLRYMTFDKHVEDRKTGKRIKLEYVFSEWTLGPAARTAFALGDDNRIERFELAWEFKGKTKAVRYDKARAIVRPPQRYADDLIVSPAGDLLVVRAADYTCLQPIRLPDGEPLPAVELPTVKTDGVPMMMEPYGRTVFAPDGRTVAVAADGVFLADPVGGTVRTLDERHFADVAFTPDGRRLIGARPDGTVVEWEAATGAAARTFDFQAAAGRLKAVAVAPDGLTAVAGGSQGRLVRWDL